jgi:hypothetical protein
MSYAQRYRETRNRYVKRIKKNKKETWQNFVIIEGNKEQWSIVYKIVRSENKKENTICSLELQDGTFTRN